MTHEQSDHDVTTNEIMEFLKEHMVMKADALTKTEGLTKQDAEKFATKADLERFATKEDLLITKQELRSEIGKLRSDITDFIDRKIDNVRGDGVLLARKQNDKLLAVVDKLEEKNVFSVADRKAIGAMDPFPKPALS